MAGADASPSLSAVSFDTVQLETGVSGSVVLSPPVPPPDAPVVVPVVPGPTPQPTASAAVANATAHVEARRSRL
jgi:hypothetical protein